MLEQKILKDKIKGCWVAKNIGGTLGMPFEWRRQINDVDFYIQDLKGKAVPNDDLELQLVNLVALEEQGLNIDARVFALYYGIFVTPHWAEYGISKANMKIGLNPPLCGYVNNNYKDSCGSYIRSELWACLCAGLPYEAVKYAIKDSMVDHGVDSEGTYAAVFSAAMQSAAFIDDDVNELIEIGLSYIPETCTVYKAITAVKDFYKSGKGYKECRDMLLEKFGAFPMFDPNERFIKTYVSDEDRKKGFDKGVIGEDVPVNIAIVVLALLYGQGDFEKTIIIANSCGEDTDCTAATAASVLGIIMGERALPEKWKKPIGKAIATSCLDITEAHFPTNTDELTDRVMTLNNKFFNEWKREWFNDAKEAFNKENLFCTDVFKKNIYRNSTAVVYTFPFFRISVDYPEGCFISKNVPLKVVLRIQNTYRITENVSVHWYLEDGFEIDKQDINVLVTNDKYDQDIKEIEFTLNDVSCVKSSCRFAVELVMNGKCDTMLVPVLLLKK